MACSRCRKKEIIRMHYINESLCPDCFTEFFERRVKRTIRRNELLGPTDRTAVALSGGKDSMTVLTILKSLSHKAPRSSLFALMIDEGVPGYRDELVKRGAKYCEELGVEYHIYSFKEELGMTVVEMAKKAEKLGYNLLPCTYCGIFRRQLLNTKARGLGATKVATGHNLDDECESALMNFLRGDVTLIARGGARVGALRDKSFVPRIKILRDTPEKEVALYAKIKKMPIVAGKCPYSRDSFRTAVNKVFLELEGKYPCMPYQILSSIDQLMPILREGIEKSGAKLGYCDDCGEVSSGAECKFCEMKRKLGVK